MLMMLKLKMCEMHEITLKMSLKGVAPIIHHLMRP